MLSTITLNFSETGTLTLPAAGITVFVGPNNSGKSLVLRELEDAFNVHPFPSNTLILKDYEVEWPLTEAVRQKIDAERARWPSDTPVGRIVVGRIKPGSGREAAQLQESSLFRNVEHREDKNWFATQYLKWGVIRLDGRSRFALTNDQPGGDLLGPPMNMLSHLFQDDETRFAIREIIFDAFSLHMVIDPTNLGTLRIRLSDTAPNDDEQSLSNQARSYYKGAMHIKDASDGVQAFTGIISAVRAGEYHTILIDEPEAFLHPPLAQKLGRNLANLASERGGTLMASTHSADFLMGCIKASSAVRVVRLEYSNGKSRARVIDPDALRSFFKRPLMRSANVISGLFHDGVVVVESDNDRAFYSEIYHRMSEKDSSLPSILFVNAQNKQTIKDIVGPLRQFGVPAVAITDIDIIKDGGKTWTDWLNAAQVPLALQLGYGQQRSAIYQALHATGKDMKRDGGIRLLSGAEKLAAEQFLQTLADYGIFAVPHGELENWLTSLEVAGKKTDWTVTMLERLGSDPGVAGYVFPATDDVWAFLNQVVCWIQNPARRGAS